MSAEAPLADTAIMPISKRLLDLCLALPALLVLSPVLAIIAAGIKHDAPGPVFFKQKRYGLGGKVFDVYKFRSMAFEAKSAAEAATFVQATQGDPRITRIGAFIRRTSIDELPQLINVVKGEMSLVGPRPHPLALDDDFSQRIPTLMQRYAATPGITGWAQINGFRGETRELADMQGRFDFDMAYIKQRNLWLDIKIIVKTAVGGWTDANAY